MIDFNKKPYFDDYDEDKGFHRILYRPSQAIQARELNQMQTILQQQIRRFGNHFFRNGAMVKPGGITYDGDFNYAKVTEEIPSKIKKFIGEKIIGGFTGTVAEYVHYAEKEGKDSQALYFKPLESGNIKYLKKFEYTFGGEDQNLEATLKSSLSKCIEGEKDEDEGIFVKDPTVSIDDDIIYYSFTDNSSITNPSGTQQPQTIETVARQTIAYNENGKLYEIFNVYKQYSSPYDMFVDGEELYHINAKAILEKRWNNETLTETEEEELKSYLICKIQSDDANGTDLTKTENTVISESVDEIYKSTSFGKGSAATIEEGYYYINGYFVKVQKQTIILDKYSNEPTAKIGLRLYDNITTPELDESLNDNAVGSYNYAAPGAHRYTMNLKLEYVPYDPNQFQDDEKETSEGSHFILLMCVKKGEVSYQVEAVTQLDLERTLARRTYDESGDYTVTPFMITPYEHLRDPDDERFVLGKYLATDNPPGDKSKIAVQVSTGKAYIRGYERGKNYVSWLDVDKARDFNTVNNESMTYSIGNFCFVTNLFQLPNMTQLEKVTLYKEDITKFGSYVGTDIGTARVRGITLDSGDSTLLNERVYRIYLFDVQCEDFSMVKSMSGYSTSSKVFTCSLDIDTNKYPGYAGLTQMLHDSKTVANIFKLSNAFIKTVAIGGHSEGEGDTSIVNQGIFEVQNELVKPVENGEYVGYYYFDMDKRDGMGYDVAKNRWIIQDTAATESENSTIRIIYIKEFQGNTGAGISSSASNVTNFPRVTVYIDRRPSGNLKITCPVFKNECTIATKVLQYYNNSEEQSQRGEVIQVPTEHITLSRVDGHRLITAWARRHIKDLLNEYEFKDVKELIEKICNNDKSVNSDSINVYKLVDKLDGSGEQEYKEFQINFNKAVISAMNAWKANTDDKLNDRLQETLVKAIIDQIQTESLKPGLFPVAINGKFCYNVTEHYTFNGGQTDSYYGYATMTINPGYTPPDSPMIVMYTFFQHSGNGDYFCIDSYKVLDKPGQGAREIPLDYDQIPVYTTESGETFSLADCMDFRPIIDNGNISSAPLYPESTIRYDYSYYLPRIDKICIDHSGEFIVVKGKSDVNPIPPEIPPDSMHLWTLYLMPYTRNLSDIRREYIDNKRYTMRDIGKLEKRINSLEYYVSLSMLEIQTLQMQITDSNGQNRFKNGFIVDPFDSHNVGESNHRDYKCSIDTVNKELRPTFATNYVEMQFNEGASKGLKRTGALVTLDYDSTPYIEQPKLTRTENVNPFAVRLFGGNLTIQPDSDQWYEKTKAGDKKVDYSPYYDSINMMAEELWDGKVWGDWYLTGTSTSTNKSVSTEIKQVTSESHVNYTAVTKGLAYKASATQVANAMATGDYAAGSSFPHPKTGAMAQTTTTTVYTRDAYTTRTYEATTTNTTTTTTNTYKRTGTEYAHSSGVMDTDIGDRTVGINDIQYMREISLLIKSDMMKPNTKVYPFFDDVAVTKYCTPCPIIDIKDLKDSKGNLITDAKKAFIVTDTVEELVSTYSGHAGKKLSIEELANTKYDFAQVVHVSYSTIQKKDKDGNPIVDSNGNPITEPNYSQITIVNWRGSVDKSIPENNKIKKGKTVYGVTTGCSCVIDSDVSAPIQGGDIITSKAGTCALMFNLPNNSETKFKTGERVFVLTDQQNNGQASQTKAEGKFVSRGYNMQTEGTILSTKTVQTTKTPITDSKTTTNTKTTSSTTNKLLQTDTIYYDTIKSRTQSTKYWDPLAQTFVVDMEGGLFITAISVIFASKDETLPIQCKLLECSNGFPTQNVLPYSTSTLYPDQITVCPDFVNGKSEKIWTRFEMEAPVYLEQDTEYAILLMSDSFDYNVYVAELGAKDLITGENISSQPYDGVLFKSQNASTWMQDQDSDLTFKLERARFSTNATFVCDNVIPKIESKNMINNIETYKNLNVIRLHHENHGLVEGDVINIKGFERDKSYNGLPGYYFLSEAASPGNSYNASTDETGGTFVVKSAELDSVLLQRTTAGNSNNNPYANLTATMNGRIADAVAEYAVNIPYDTFKPSVSCINVSGTNIDWYYHFVTQKSIGGNGTSKKYIKSNETSTVGIPMVMNDNNNLPSHGAIFSEFNPNNFDDEQDKNQRSLRFIGELTSEMNNLTPVIDLNRCGCVLVTNRVDYPELNPVYPKISFIKDSDKLKISFDKAHGLTEGAMVYWDTSKEVDDLLTTQVVDELTGKVIMTQTTINTDATVFPVIDPNEATVTGTTLGTTSKSKNTMYAYSLEGWYPIILNPNESKEVFNSVKDSANSTREDEEKYFYIQLPGKASKTEEYDLSMQNSATPNANVVGFNDICFYVSSTHHKYVPENKSINASCASRYFTKKVTLDNPSTAAKIMFTCACPDAADFQIWVKTQTRYETRDFDEIDWTRVNVPEFNKRTSIDTTDYKDYEATLEFADGSVEQEANEFVAIAVKIVMLSKDQTQVPVFKNLRVICLAT